MEDALKEWKGFLSKPVTRGELFRLTMCAIGGGLITHWLLY
jgi:hypothetical protein